MLKKILFLTVIIIVCLSSCESRRVESVLPEGDTITSCAQLLTMVQCQDYIVADVKDPWNRDRLLARYILVNREQEIKSQLPQGIVIKTPIETSLVYSSVHAGVIDELGSIDAVTAVCDAQYYKMPNVKERLKCGTIVDAGSSMSPNVEIIISHNPDAILCSPFQNAGHGAIEQLGISIIECADYMESSPLGRAEWVKFIGAIYGQQEKADSIFDVVSSNYNILQELTRGIGNRPTVISEMVTDGVWYMPGGASYMAKMFSDAGGNYMWRDDTSTGSLQLDFATVYDRAQNADYWLIKKFGIDLTLDALERDYALHSRMAAFSHGGVYSCNTATTTLFEDFPFHPDVLLREYVKIFHDELLPEYNLKYYKPVK